MAKYNPAKVQSDLKSKISGLHAQAHELKEQYRAAREGILQDPRLSEAAKAEDTAKLTEGVASKLQDLRAEQARYVESLRRDVERELLGNLPSDANSVMLRRDAAERARKVADEREAVAVLRDAARVGDESLVHAIGYRARQSTWLEALDAYREAAPESADTAMALAEVEAVASDPGLNLASQIAYSGPGEG